MSAVAQRSSSRHLTGFGSIKMRQFKRGDIEGPKKHTKVNNVEYFDEKRFQTCTPPAIQIVHKDECVVKLLNWFL